MKSKLNRGDRWWLSRRITIASRRILWLTGLPVIALLWMGSVVVMVVSLLAIAVWVFLSGGEDAGELTLLDKIDNAPSVLWNKWGKLLPFLLALLLTGCWEFPAAQLRYDARRIAAKEAYWNRYWTTHKSNDPNE